MSNTHMHHHSNDTEQLRDHVLEAIKRGETRMKPRWRFVLLSVAAAGIIAGTILLLLFAVSLSLFLWRESGAWLAVSFGVRGWLSLIRSVPLAHVAFVLILILILEALVRRYAFVYQRPLLGTFAVIAGFIVFGGALIDQTPFHSEVASYVRTHEIPIPLSVPYGNSMRVSRPPDLYEGIVVEADDGELLVVLAGDADPDAGLGEATTTARAKKTATVRANEIGSDTVAPQSPLNATGTQPRSQKEKPEEVPADGWAEREKRRSRIVITPHTRLPHGKSFKVGARVVVGGDRLDEDTIEAFGVREIDD